MLQPVIPSITPESARNVQRSTEWLSADERQGRGNGTAELTRAAEWVAERFRAAGLKPGWQGRFEQEFRVDSEGWQLRNIIGILPASSRTEEYLLLTAHLDGLGVGAPDESGDRIYNGALDNAIGVAALIELARLLTAGPAPPRNIVFMATSGEEGGAWGARHFLEDPVFPLESLRMVINIDGFNVYGRARDIAIMPRSGVDFVPEIRRVAEQMGLADGTPDWVDQMDRSFDTGPFLAAGIPAVTIWAGDDLEEMTAPETLHFKQEIGRRHHTPQDEVHPGWLWTGIAQHLELHLRLVRHYLTAERPQVTDPARFQK